MWRRKGLIWNKKCDEWECVYSSLVARDLSVQLSSLLAVGPTFLVATELFAVTSLTDLSCDLFGHGRFPDMELSIALVCWQASLH